MTDKKHKDNEKRERSNAAKGGIALGVVALLVVGVVVIWGAGTNWKYNIGPGTGTGVATDCTFLPVDTATGAVVNCTVTFRDVNTHGMSSAEIDALTRANLTLIETDTINSTDNSSVSITPLANYVMWAEFTPWDGNYSVQSAVVAVGTFPVYFLNQSLTFHALAVSENLTTTLANTHTAKWTLTLGCFNSTGGIAYDNGYSYWWNDTVTGVNESVAGLNNEGMCLNFTFTSAPENWSVIVAGIDYNNSIAVGVGGNSVIVFLAQDIRGITPISFTLDAAVVDGTNPLVSLKIGLGSVADHIATPLVTLT